MSSPIRSPEGHWWHWPVARLEKTWLGLAGLVALILFAWMFGWMYAGGQNPTGPTYRVSPERFQQKMIAYQDSAHRTERGLVPAGDDFYVAALQFGWQGLPVVLEAGKQYRLHLSSLDVQHGFSIRRADELWKQVNLQALPGYEWVIPMRFEEPGTYYVVCNEFCGVGHRTMSAKFRVVESGTGPYASTAEEEDGSPETERLSRAGGS